MIYIVEDDDNIRQMEAYALRGSGFELEKLTPGELEKFKVVYIIL